MKDTDLGYWGLMISILVLFFGTITATYFLFGS